MRTQAAGKPNEGQGPNLRLLISMYERRKPSARREEPEDVLGELDDS